MPRRNVVIDIETDSLKPTRLWCISTLEIDTDVVRTWDVREGFGGFLEFSKDSDIYWVGHNVIDFDFPVLKKFIKGFTYDLAKTRDTLVMSRLANQERDGGHSLENWGNILGYHKSEFSDFSQFSQQMLDYCIQDTRVTARVFKQVLRELADFDMRSLRIEQETVQVLQRMEERGYTLDYEFTTELLTTVTTLRDRLAISLSESAPKLPKFKRLIEPKITKKGEYYHHNVNALGDQVKYLEGQASLIDWITFNPGSHSQVAWQLMLRGWVPTVFTEAGAPSTSEEVLEELYETMPEARDITQYFMLVKRQGQIKSWVELYNHETGRVHGHINHIGARTHRASHSNPNMAQIPAVKRDTKGNILLGLDGTFNAECRKCWKAAPGFKQVGVDAAAIQLVILAHAMGDESYSESVAFGDKKLGTDVHTRNRNILRETITKLTRRNDVDYISRDVAKTYCVPLNTQILTPTGWKNHDEVSVGSPCFSYNSESGNIELDEVLAIHRKRAEVANYRSSSWSFTCTPDHRWFGQKRRQSGHRGPKYFEDTFFTLEDKGEFKLLLNAPVKHIGDLDLTEQEVSAIAWLVTDGWWEWSPVSRRINDRGINNSIVQSERKFYKKILSLLGNLVVGDYVNKVNDCHNIRISPSWLRYLFAKCGFVGKNKYEVDWPAFIMRLSPEARKTFVEVFHEAEGWAASHGVKMVTQKNTVVTEAVILACFMSGIDTRTHLQQNGQHITRLRSRSHLHTQCLQKETLGEEEVWCVTTKRGTWVAKQGLVMTITGNCYAFLLGAGAAKVDTILNTAGIGASIKKEFLERIPALKALLDRLRREVRETGRIAGLDGRFFPCDDPHFALAYILQGFEAAIMKLALIYTQRWFDKHFGDDLVGILTWVHDEFQMEALDCTVAYQGCSDFPVGKYYLPELVRGKTVKIIEQVGREFNLKCFLTGEGRVGNDWLETH